METMGSLRTGDHDDSGEPISRPIPRRPRTRRYARTIVGVGAAERELAGRARGRAPELSRGASVADYVVDYRIGRGRHGVTYKAIRGCDMQPVVLKVWDGPVGSDELSKQAKLIGVSTNHPHLARVLDAGLIDGLFLYQVRELLYGEPWDRWLKNRQERDAQSIAWIASELTTALASLHDAGLTHGMVHAGNVLLIAEHGRHRPVLLDCGLGPRNTATPTGDPIVSDVAALAATVRQATNQEAPLRPIGAEASRPGAPPVVDFRGRAALDAVLAPIARGGECVASPDRLAAALLEAAGSFASVRARPRSARQWVWWALCVPVVALGLAAAYLALHS